MSGKKTGHYSGHRLPALSPVNIHPGYNNQGDHFIDASAEFYRRLERVKKHKSL